MRNSKEKFKRKNLKKGDVSITEEVNGNYMDNHEK